jgi:hypothetical protein
MKRDMHHADNAMSKRNIAEDKVHLMERFSIGYTVANYKHLHKRDVIISPWALNCRFTFECKSLFCYFLNYNCYCGIAGPRGFPRGAHTPRRQTGRIQTEDCSIFFPYPTMMALILYKWQAGSSHLDERATLESVPALFVCTLSSSDPKTG